MAFVWRRRSEFCVGDYQVKFPYAILAPMKLWHDDVRPAPAGWLWAQNNIQARKILLDEVVDECSLDHDLGCLPVEGIYAKGSAEETGLDLVKWMIEADCVPQKVAIHSWNPVGAMRMAKALDEAGLPVMIKPYEAGEFVKVTNK
jgi:hypothetical protein